MVPAAVKIDSGNTANVTDCVSEQTRSQSKVLSCNTPSKTVIIQNDIHTVSEMLHDRYRKLCARLILTFDN